MLQENVRGCKRVTGVKVVFCDVSIFLFQAAIAIQPETNVISFLIKFAECLCHTKGTWAGKPFKLLDWQERIIRDLFGIIKSNGYRQFNTAYIEIPKKNGKELSLDTLIPTPDGFTTMGEIQVGDTVFDEKGNPCHVVAKSPIDDTEQAYRLTFTDGSFIVAMQW